MSDRFDLSGALLGLLFVVLGVAFLLQALDVWTLRFSVFAPAVLIALGVVVLLGAFAGRRDRDGDRRVDEP